MAFLGTFVNNTGIETVVRGSEATMTKQAASMVFEPQPGVGKPRQEVPAQIPALGEGHNGLAEAHLKDFFQCVRTRQKPRGDLELAFLEIGQRHQRNGAGWLVTECHRHRPQRVSLHAV